ncbi:MAG: nuclear transport factor 2 family protein [Ferruginibacter sp.]
MKNAKEIKQPTTKDAKMLVILHHLASFQDNDLEAVISDYTNESVLITPDATYKGPEEIKIFFAALMIHFPKQKSSFEMDKVVVSNELVYIVWHANTPSLDVSMGTDTFIIRNGKINQQTFAGLLKFK